MGKIWTLKNLVSKEMGEQFPELSGLQTQLLYNLGLTDPGRIDWFLNPDYHNLYDPMIFTDMEKAVKRTWSAINNAEKILIYGDYDADAVTANAVLQHTFQYLNVQVSSYVPDRFTEGYGLNIKAFQKIYDSGVKLIITVDCGTNSVDVANFCLEKGIDLIITDHHEITGDIPKAYALINPKNPNEVYPDKQITGVGVAYKFAKALLLDHDKVIIARGIDPASHIPEWDKWLLDLVAIGTVADCHSLLGENRILVTFGLRVLQKTKWLGLRLLIENAGMDFAKKAPDSTALGFQIAPRINAAGRLEHADIALNLLTTNDYAMAIDLANQIEEINRRRQDITKRIISEAKEKAQLINDRKILVLEDTSWSKGVVGIVAGRLADAYNRPVIVLSRNEQELTGSARSNNGFDLVSALRAVSAHLSQYGGHKEAVGLTVASDKFEEFYVALLKYAESNWPTEATDVVLSLDAELSETDFTLDRFEEIKQFEPFGAGNPTPKFLVPAVKVISYKLVGATAKHLQMQVLFGETIIECIGFNFSFIAPKLVVGKEISLVGELIADSWNGFKKLKLRLIDIKIVEPENILQENDTVKFQEEIVA